MKEIQLERGGVTDWPAMMDLLMDDPSLIAVTSSAEAMKRLPKARTLCVPWLEKNVVYLMHEETVNEMIESSSELIGAVRSYAQGREKAVAD